ncbi:TM2 domain-containing protein [Paracoccus shanxieyensis]|uniref:NINE protein n=1 Tax=Paracoccus shanxieyensis TaxID=2675752 RepID=A0A6L6ISB8_9RHOB|nr:TM2 domain-containing protein [Paracoccus shanxieyensis]MTH62759.1 NINE protein [Paracoccus shanxieyensis]MTH86157.1 NINE protein [Paracoccus shanxieyensis]
MDNQRELLIEQRVANDAKSPLVAYLLAIFLWGFGLHRMYLGRWISGFVMLAMWGVGWLTAPILIGWPLVALVGIWNIIDLFLIPGMVQEDKDDIRRRLGSDLRY